VNGRAFVGAVDARFERFPAGEGHPENSRQTVKKGPRQNRGPSIAQGSYFFLRKISANGARSMSPRDAAPVEEQPPEEESPLPAVIAKGPGSP